MDSDEKRTSKQPSTNIDKGWAWVVLSASFLSNIIVDGIVYASGHVLQPVWMETFYAGSGEAAVPVAFFVAIYFVGGPYVGRLIERHGCKTVAKFGSALSVFGLFCTAMATSITGLCITHGLMTGFGFAMLYITSVTVIEDYFQLKRLLALTIVIAGSGIGTFLFAPLIQSMTASHGWREAVAVLGVMVALTFFTALMYEPVTIKDVKEYPNDVSNSVQSAVEAVKRISVGIKEQNFRNIFGKTETAEEKTKSSTIDFQLMKSPTFSLLCISTCFTMMGLFVPYVFLPQLAMSRNYSSAKSTLLVSFLGMFNVISRMPFSYYVNRSDRDVIIVSNVSLMVAGFFTILVPTFHDYWLFIIFTMVFSVGTGAFAALRSAMCLEICGKRLLKKSWNLVMLFMGLGVIVGLPLAGSFNDLTDEHETSFYVAGLFILFSGAIAWSLKKLKHWELSKLLKQYAENEDQESGLKSESGSDVGNLPASTTSTDVGKKTPSAKEKFKYPTKDSEKSKKAVIENKAKTSKQLRSPKKTPIKQNKDSALLDSTKRTKYGHPEQKIKIETKQRSKSPMKHTDDQPTKSERRLMQFWKGLSSSSQSPVGKNVKNSGADDHNQGSAKSYSIVETTTSSKSYRRVYKSPKLDDTTLATKSTPADPADAAHSVSPLKRTLKQRYFRSRTPKSPATQSPKLTTTNYDNPLSGTKMKPFGPIDDGEVDRQVPKRKDDSKSEQGSDESTKKPPGGFQSPRLRLLTEWFKGHKQSGSSPRKQDSHRRDVRKVNVSKPKKSPGLATNSFMSASKNVLCGLTGRKPAPMVAKHAMKTPEKVATVSASPVQKQKAGNAAASKKSKESDQVKKTYKSTRI